MKGDEAGAIKCRDGGGVDAARSMLSVTISQSVKRRCSLLPFLPHSIVRALYLPPLASCPRSGAQIRIARSCIQHVSLAYLDAAAPEIVAGGRRARRHRCSAIGRARRRSVRVGPWGTWARGDSRGDDEMCQGDGVDGEGSGWCRAGGGLEYWMRR